MAKITIELGNYVPEAPGIFVDAFEGQVHLDAMATEKGYPSMSPAEARLLAVVLNTQADAAERGPQ